jgi:methionyl aminopeptidase
MIIIKTMEEIKKIRESSRIVAEVLETLREFVRPGITTWALNKKAEEVIKKRKARAAFKGYKPSFGSKPYPAALCVSINEEIIHGIPSRKRVIKEGDVVSMDVGVCYGGYFGDAATTVGVGDIGDKRRRLLAVTEEALYRGIGEARAGNRVGDVSITELIWCVFHFLIRFEIEVLFTITSAANTLPFQSAVFNSFCQTTHIRRRRLKYD